MLIVEENSVYEIDEECLQRRKVPKECQIHEKIMQCIEADGKKKEEKKISK
ncbi:MAG: hypothetical protein PUB98_02410 [Clostridiales bacterium]|nr:hypothetical protein [Clostridiales bacterium]